MLMMRLTLAACGTATGLYCGMAAFQMGANLAQSWEGLIFGGAFTGVVVGSWFLLPTAARAKAAGDRGVMWALRGGYLVAFAFVIINAVGYTALHRSNVVVQKAGVIDQYEDALKERREVEADLQAAKTNVRWAETSSCTATKTRAEKAFCSNVESLSAKIQAARVVLASGRPGEADPVASTVAWVIQADERKVSRADPIYKALALEVMTTIFWAGALLNNKRVHSKVPANAPKPAPEPAPVPAKKTGRRKSKRHAVWADDSILVGLTPHQKGMITKRIKRLQAQAAAQSSK